MSANGIAAGDPEQPAGADSLVLVGYVKQHYADLVAEHKTKSSLSWRTPMVFATKSGTDVVMVPNRRIATALTTSSEDEVTNTCVRC